MKRIYFQFKIQKYLRSSLFCSQPKNVLQIKSVFPLNTRLVNLSLKTIKIFTKHSELRHEFEVWFVWIEWDLSLDLKWVAKLVRSYTLADNVYFWDLFMYNLWAWYIYSESLLILNYLIAFKRYTQWWLKRTSSTANKTANL